MRGGWEQGGEGQIATVRTVTYSELIIVRGEIEEA